VALCGPAGDTGRAMSQENVEIVRRAVDMLNAGEVPEFMAPDLVLENATTAVTDKTYVGAEGWREWMDDMFGAFGEDARLQIDEILADGEDYVVAITALRGCGAASGAPLQLRWVTAVWLRGGLVTRVSGFPKRREALEAVGLRE